MSAHEKMLKTQREHKARDQHVSGMLATRSFAYDIDS
jgi:hypothetical protein